MKFYEVFKQKPIIGMLHLAEENPVLLQTADGTITVCGSSSLTE